MVERWVRKSGFDLPLNPLQVISWFVFAFDVITFFVVDMISLAYNPGLVAVLSILFIVMQIGTVYYCVKATKTDPTDPTIQL